MMIFVRQFNLFLTLFFCLVWVQGIDSATPPWRYAKAKPLPTKAPGPFLVYIYTRGFLPMWDDIGSKAKLDVSIWKPTDKTFFALGDVIQSGYDYPTKEVMMVMDRGDKLVAPPVGFTSVWDSYLSNTRTRIALYKMIAPAGYTCIGHAVYSGDLTTLPNKNAYRCLRSDLVTGGTVGNSYLWSTEGSATKKKNSFWNVNVDPLGVGGMATGLFLVGNSETAPPLEKASVVLSSKLISSESASTINPKDIALILYQTSDVDKIWDDTAGIKAKIGTEASIWRIKDNLCCSLGDMVAPHFNQIVGFIAKEVKLKTLAKPSSFQKVMSNRNGIGNKITIWSLVCPPGFVALGNLITPDYDTPTVDNSTIRCVSQTIVGKGKWTSIWNDKNSGSNLGGTFWMAEASSTATTDVSAMTAVHGYDTTPPAGDAYVLRSAYVVVRQSKPISKVQVGNLFYDLSQKKIISSTPFDQASNAPIQNCDSKSPPFQGAIAKTITTQTEQSWSTEMTVEIGAEFSFSAGIPDVTSVTETFHVSFSTTWGQETKRIESKTEQVQGQATIPPGFETSILITGNTYVAQVPWSADVITTYLDGTTSASTTTGIYKGMRVLEMTISQGRTTPCSLSRK